MNTPTNTDGLAEILESTKLFTATGGKQGISVDQAIAAINELISQKLTAMQRIEKQYYNELFETVIGADESTDTGVRHKIRQQARIRWYAAQGKSDE